MKALTISQPYATLIATGEKWVENRRWGTAYRGPLAIHAGKGTQYMDRRDLLALATEYPTGCIMAVAELVACVNIERTRRWDRSTVLATGITVDDVLSHEHAEGPWCWVLQNIRRLSAIVYCPGSQGLWDVRAPASRELLRQLLHGKETSNDGTKQV